METRGIEEERISQRWEMKKETLRARCRRGERERENVRAEKGKGKRRVTTYFIPTKSQPQYASGTAQAVKKDASFLNLAVIDLFTTLFLKLA